MCLPLLDMIKQCTNFVNSVYADWKENTDFPEFSHYQNSRIFPIVRELFKISRFFPGTKRGIVPIWYTEWKPGFKKRHVISSYFCLSLYFYFIFIIYTLKCTFEHKIYLNLYKCRKNRIDGWMDGGVFYRYCTLYDKSPRIIQRGQKSGKNV